MRKNERFIRKSIALLLAATTACGTMGCSNAIESKIENVKSIFNDEDALHKSPRFLKYATSVDNGCLYQVQNDLFYNHIYNNILPLGDRILLIGEGNYSSKGDSGSNYGFEFSLYSPWSNRIIASIDPEDTNSGSYKQVGDYLFVSTANELETSDWQAVDVFNSSLKRIGSFDTSALPDSGSLDFYPSPDSDTFIAVRNDDNENCFYTFKINSEDCEFESVEFPYYDSSVISASKDNSALLVKGINPDNMLSCYYYLDLETYSVTDEYDYYNSNPVTCNEDKIICSTGVSSNSYALLDNKKSRYFNYKNLDNAIICDDGSFILSTNHMDDDNHYILEYSKYDSTGKFISSFNFDCGQYKSDEFKYMSNDNVLYSDDGYLFILIYDQVSYYPYFLMWDSDLSLDSSKSLAKPKSLKLYRKYDNYLYKYQEANSTDDFSSYISNINDFSYNWGHLTLANSKASSMENKYDIDIYLGEEVPERLGQYKVDQETNAGNISDALNNLNNVLASYPDNFLAQLKHGTLRGIKVYITGRISASGDNQLEESGGFVTVINNYMVMVLNASYSNDWDYTVNHEISHLIDEKLTYLAKYKSSASFSENKWESFLPDGCNYLNSYENYEESPVYCNYPDYFVDEYGTSYATEDRAELFGYAMSDYLESDNMDDTFTKDGPLYLKHTYYCNCIREDFDTEGWPDICPWEAVLYQ